MQSLEEKVDTVIQKVDHLQEDFTKMNEAYKAAHGFYTIPKAQTEEELWKKLATLYFSNEHIEKMTFYGLYEEWIDYKKDMTGSPNTITRHRQHYKKYLESSALHNLKLKQLDSLTLEKECNRIVKSFNLSR